MPKNRPIITTNWKKNITSPPVIWRFPNSDGVTSGSDPAIEAADVLHEQRIAEPCKIDHTTGDIPNTDGAPSAGRSQPHSEERSTPKTTSPMPTAQSSEPSRSRCVRSRPVRRRPGGRTG